jgi:hypothetical protein
MSMPLVKVGDSHNLNENESGIHKGFLDWWSLCGIGDSVDCDELAGEYIATWMQLSLGVGMMMDSDYGGWLPIRQSRKPYPSYIAGAGRQRRRRRRRLPHL